MIEPVAAPMVLNYNNLPDVLETKEDLYNLIVVASRKFQQPSYASRLASKGMTFMDLADELFLKFMTGGLIPKHRRKGSGTKPAESVLLPIKKKNAYAMLTRDLLDIIRKRTPEEKASIQLVSTSEVQ